MARLSDALTRTRTKGAYMCTTPSSDAMFDAHAPVLVFARNGLLARTAPGGADPYHFNLQAHPSECPDPTALRNAVDSVRPAGVRWTLVLSDTWTIFQMEAAYASISALEAAFTTITGLETDNPGH